MRLSRLIRGVAAILAFLALSKIVSAQSPWQQPAADLAAQIAAILGHGTARLMIRDLSSLPVDEIPLIRKDLEADLRAHGVTANSAPNETVIRVTLSESAHGFTWVAEIIRGDDTQVAVVNIPPVRPSSILPRAEMILRRVALFESKEPVLGGYESETDLVLLTPGAIKHEALGDMGWIEKQSIPIPGRSQLSRDPRGVLTVTSRKSYLDEFEAWLPGVHCTGSLESHENLKVDCHASDDPWPLAGISQTPPPATSSAPNTPTSPATPAQAALAAPTLRAFFNNTRNYFTGIVSPGLGVDLPPFYSAAIVPWKTPNALVIGTIDGKVMLSDAGKLITFNGTDDWGSEFAAIRYECGAGLVIASGAGNSNTDSLRAYEMIGSSAQPRSAPLTIDGTVTAVWTEPDGKSVYAVIRNAQNQYEVDRVSALCN